MPDCTLADCLIECNVYHRDKRGEIRVSLALAASREKGVVLISKSGENPRAAIRRYLFTMVYSIIDSSFKGACTRGYFPVARRRKFLSNKNFSLLCVALPKMQTSRNTRAFLKIL